MNDQPLAAESAPAASVEDRLAAFFGGSQPKPAAQPAAQPSDASEAQPADLSAEPPINGTPAEGDEQPEGASPEVPTEEVDWEGERYLIPAKLKPALMMQADYTRKTQEVAEIRKAMEAERLVLQSTQLFNQQVQPLLSQKAQLQSMKEQAKKIDWTALTTDQKIDLDRELRNIDSQLSDIDRDLGAKRQEHEEGFTRAVVQAVQATENYMAQKVPGWNQAAGNSLHDYGTALGIPKQKLTAGWFSDPVATHIMYKAQQWDNLQAGKPAVANKVANAPPVVKAASGAVQQSQNANQYRAARDNLRKTGSVEAFASALLASQRKR